MPTRLLVEKRRLAVRKMPIRIVPAKAWTARVHFLLGGLLNCWQGSQLGSILHTWVLKNSTTIQKFVLSFLLALCAENSISRNGLEPCFDCPESFKQILKGQKMCEHESCATGQCQYSTLYAMHPCVRQKPCSSTAACVPSSPTAHSYQCKCPVGWRGTVTLFKLK